MVARLEVLLCQQRVTAFHFEKDTEILDLYKGFHKAPRWVGETIGQAFGFTFDLLEPPDTM